MEQMDACEHDFSVIFSSDIFTIGLVGVSDFNIKEEDSDCGMFVACVHLCVCY